MSRAEAGVLFIAISIAGVSCVPKAPPPETVAAAADELVRSAEARAQADAGELDAEARADLFNRLAWFDDRPGAVVLTRGPRGRIQRLGGRNLGHEFASALPAEPSRERAEAFFDRKGLGRTLLGLSSAEDIRFVRPLLGRGGRYEFQQHHRDRRVFGAIAILRLDESGGFAGLDSHLAGNISVARGRAISEEDAIAAAIEHVAQSADPLWREVDPRADSVELVVFDRLPSTGRDEFRNAYLVVVVPARGAGGRREVVVDELSGEVLDSIERARLMLDRNDEVSQVDGFIGGGTPVARVPPLWRGGDACPPASAPPLGTTPLERDLNETTASVCELERFFAERGGEFGSADFHPWIDANDCGLNLRIGATGALSIGINSNGDCPAITFATGTGRAEVVGHELAHSLFGSAGSLAAFRGGGVEADGAAVEEHLGDLLGSLVERRFPRRIEDPCLLTDDPDSLDTIGAVMYPPVPCRSQRLPWRSLCAPQTDNGGWCEGAATFQDKASNGYDLGFPGFDAGDHGLSHSNLGIGNRQASALFKNTGVDTTIERFTVGGIGQARSERLFLGVATNLPSSVSWSSYGEAWIESAAELDAADGVPAPPAPSLENNVRSALAGVKIWSLPRPMSVSSGLLSEVTRGTRPAVASIIREDGGERTYTFYRSSDVGDAIYYVWRDEVAGARFAEESETPFQGPCRLEDARSVESPAAVGRNGNLYVAWSEPTGEAGVGTVNGFRLRAENLAEAGCDDDWEYHPPGLRTTAGGEVSFAERRLEGAPSLVIWTARREADVDGPEEMFRCDPRLHSPVPPNFPRYPIGPLGPTGWEIDLCSLLPPSPQGPPRPLPPEFAARLEDLLAPVLESRFARAIPSIFDPLGPSWTLEDEELEHGFAAGAFMRSDSEVRDGFNQLMEDFGLEFRFAADGSEPGIDPLSRDLPNPDFSPSIGNFRIKYFLPNGPPSFIFSSPVEQLVLGFRDPEDRLRVVRYADASPTDSADDGSPVIPVLAEGIGPTDPALSAVRMARDEDFLVAVYGVEHNGNPTGLAYRTLRGVTRSGVWDASFFTAERRIDQIRGQRHGALRRRIDYAYVRTLQAPAVAGGLRHLYLAVNELAHGTAVSGDPDAPGYDPFPDTASARSDSWNRVRFASLRMTFDGILEAVGERPVRLTNTAIVSRASPLRSGRQAQVGALQVPQHRNLLRFYFPNGQDLGVKSRVVLE